MNTLRRERTIMLFARGRAFILISSLALDGVAASDPTEIYLDMLSVGNCGLPSGGPQVPPSQSFNFKQSCSLISGTADCYGGTCLNAQGGLYLNARCDNNDVFTTWEYTTPYCTGQSRMVTFPAVGDAVCFNIAPSGPSMSYICPGYNPAGGFGIGPIIGISVGCSSLAIFLLVIAFRFFKRVRSVDQSGAMLNVSAPGKSLGGLPGKEMYDWGG